MDKWHHKIEAIWRRGTIHRTMKHRFQKPITRTSNVIMLLGPMLLPVLSTPAFRGWRPKHWPTRAASMPSALAMAVAVAEVAKGYKVGLLCQRN